MSQLQQKAVKPRVTGCTGSTPATVATAVDTFVNSLNLLLDISVILANGTMQTPGPVLYGSITVGDILQENTSSQGITYLATVHWSEIIAPTVS